MAKSIRSAGSALGALSVGMLEMVLNKPVLLALLACVACLTVGWVLLDGRGTGGGVAVVPDRSAIDESSDRLSPVPDTTGQGDRSIPITSADYGGISGGAHRSERDDVKDQEERRLKSRARFAESQIDLFKMGLTREQAGELVAALAKSDLSKQQIQTALDNAYYEVHREVRNLDRLVQAEFQKLIDSPEGAAATVTLGEGASVEQQAEASVKVKEWIESNRDVDGVALRNGRVIHSRNGIIGYSCLEIDLLAPSDFSVKYSRVRFEKERAVEKMLERVLSELRR